jgi:hypothetical protein
MIKNSNNKPHFILLIICFILFIFNGIFNINQPILEAHGFRQTQTAITSFYLSDLHSIFNYQTPILGEPWSIPFEFPVYQFLANLFSSKSVLSLTVAGRLISLLSYIGVLLVIVKIFNILKLNIYCKLIPIIVILSSPLYLFWSSTFMIEGLALFLTFYFFYFAIKFSIDLKITNCFLFGLFLTLALLQKPTTSLPVLFFLYFYFLYFYRNFIKSKIHLITLILNCTVPLVILYSWTSHADINKFLNPLAQGLTSSSLFEWNFGNFSQRISSELWFDTIFKRDLKTNCFGIFGILICAISLFLTKNLNKNIIIILLILFILPYLIFTNLYIRHDYYPCANLIFFLIAFSLSLYSIISRFNFLYNYIILIVLLLFNYNSYIQSYFKYKKLDISLSNSKILQIADIIKINTSKDRPVVFYGFDWSSEISFYSERKSLTVPNWSNFEIDTINNLNRYLPSLYPSSVVLCPTAHSKEIRSFLLDYSAIKTIIKNQDCEIFIFENNLN